MANTKHPCLILHNFLSLDLCKELEFINKSCSTVGYRPNVFSTTLSHLIATNCAHLIMPIIPIREKLREKAEEYFGCQYELFVEFTGLIRHIHKVMKHWRRHIHKVTKLRQLMQDIGKTTKQFRKIGSMLSTSYMPFSLTSYSVV